MGDIRDAGHSTCSSPDPEDHSTVSVGLSNDRIIRFHEILTSANRTARTAQAVIVTPGTRDPAPSPTTATLPTALTRNVPTATSTGKPSPPHSTTTTPRAIAVSTSVITRSALTTIIALPDGSKSTMTVVPAYSITSLIYSTVNGGGASLSGTQIASTYTPAMYTGKANRLRHGFLVWIIGVVGAAML